MDPLNHPAIPPHADANLTAQFIVPERHPPALGGDRPAGISLDGAVFSVRETSAGEYVISFDFTDAPDRTRGEDGTVGLRLVRAGPGEVDVYAGRHLPPDPHEPGVVLRLPGKGRRQPYAG